MLKCPHERKNIRATIECLRSKNATDLVNSEWQGIAFGIAEFPFVPVIDGAFLDETPQKSMDTKNFKKTNIMMGANKDEGVFFILYYLTDLFKNEETVFVNREDFIKSVGELNIYVKSVGREVCVLVFLIFPIKEVLIPIITVHSLMKMSRKFTLKIFPIRNGFSATPAVD